MLAELPQKSGLAIPARQVGLSWCQADKILHIECDRSRRNTYRRLMHAKYMHELCSLLMHLPIYYMLLVVTIVL
jgi:hypothetical protein